MVISETGECREEEDDSIFDHLLSYLVEKMAQNGDFVSLPGTIGNF